MRDKAEDLSADDYNKVGADYNDVLSKVISGEIKPQSTLNILREQKESLIKCAELGMKYSAIANLLNKNNPTLKVTGRQIKTVCEEGEDKSKRKKSHCKASKAQKTSTSTGASQPQNSPQKNQDNSEDKTHDNSNVIPRETSNIRNAEEL